MLLQVSLASVITYQMLTLADFDAVALELTAKQRPFCMAKLFKKIARWILSHKILLISIATLILIKVVWVAWGCWNNGNPNKEKEDILQRRNWLVEKIVVEPRQLLNEMPGGIGLQFQGEWTEPCFQTFL